MFRLFHSIYITYMIVRRDFQVKQRHTSAEIQYVARNTEEHRV